MSILEVELSRIYEERGTLDPDDVHDIVADPSHPLHSRYEWDDRVAGRAYRKIQIKEDIRSVERVWIDSGGARRSARLFLSRRELGQSENGYVAASEALRDDATLVLLRRNCELEVRQLRRRYANLKEFADIVKRELPGVL
jgi:hypothetical protein